MKKFLMPILMITLLFTLCISTAFAIDALAQNPTEISLVEFEEFTFPYAGEDFNAKDVKLKSGFPGTIESAYFYLDGTTKTIGGASSNGDKVQLYIRVQLNNGYKFSQSPNAKLNGKTQDMRVNVTSSLYGFVYNYTVVRNPNKPAETFTITVDYDDKEVKGGKIYLKTDKGTNDFQTEGYRLSATEGTTAEVKAASDAGNKFLHWVTGFGRGEKIVSTEPNYSFEVQGNYTLRAVFEIEKAPEYVPVKDDKPKINLESKEYNIAVDYNDENIKGGQLYLQTDQGIIDYQSERCSLKATQDTSVTVMASTIAGYEFVHWISEREVVSRQPFMIFNAKEDRTFYAVYEKVESSEDETVIQETTKPVLQPSMYTITVDYDDENIKGGQLYLETDQGKIDYQSSKCTLGAMQKSTVTIMASTTAGYEFVHWLSGNEVLSTNMYYIFKADKDMEIHAVYKKVEVSSDYVEVEKEEIKYYEPNKEDEEEVAIEINTPIESNTSGETNTSGDTKEITWNNAHDWAKDELDKAKKKGVIPEIFNKQDLTKNITRKEFAHVVVKLYETLTGNKATSPEKNPFKDTEDSEVLKAFNLGITSGTSDDTFSPDALITREQMATMLKRALEKAGIDIKVDLDKVEKFADDNELHDWGKEAVYYMSQLGLIKGIGENKFGVQGDATREQSLLISVRGVEEFSK